MIQDDTDDNQVIIHNNQIIINLKERIIELGKDNAVLQTENRLQKEVIKELKEDKVDLKQTLHLEKVNSSRL